MSGLGPIPVAVAAGGGSSRCPEGKLLKLWQGKPLLEWLLERLSNHPRTGALVVVTGHQRYEVEALVARFPRATACFNADWAQGLSSTLKLGVSFLPKETAGFLVALGDTPLFSSETLDAVLPSDAHEGKIRVPTYRGQRGHPVYFPAWTRSHWGNLSGDQGARALLADWSDRLVEIPLDDPGILRDFDRAEDFEGHPSEAGP